MVNQIFHNIVAIQIGNMAMEPKVSIIMPSLNVAKYIEQCVESVINQSLKDIEILCIDAKSTDGTLEILREYEKQDNRIQVIVSDIKSYGYQMNLGLKRARGKYIGIVETDDWIDFDMFETLYETAEKNSVEMVKANYYLYNTLEGEHNKFYLNYRGGIFESSFLPIESKALWASPPAIWSGLYKRSMLLDNDIHFNETVGASYQDASFHFMVCTVAKSCYLIKEAFLHYRTDNEASSVNSPGKVFCICDEMHYFENFLEKYPEKKEYIMPYYMFLKYDKYRWNYLRLNEKLRKEFLKVMHEEFFYASRNNLLSEKCFSENDWNELQTLIYKPQKYLNNKPSIKGRVCSIMKFVHKNGLVVTMKKVVQKLIG